MQAFVLALRFAAHELLRFELEKGVRIDAWDWSSLIPLIADAPIDPYMRGRVTEIQNALRAGTEETSGPRPAAATRKPRAAKPRAAAVRDNRSRSRSR